MSLVHWGTSLAAACDQYEFSTIVQIKAEMRNFDLHILIPIQDKQTCAKLSKYDKI